MVDNHIFKNIKKENKLMTKQCYKLEVNFEVS